MSRFLAFAIAACRLVAAGCGGSGHGGDPPDAASLPPVLVELGPTPPPLLSSYHLFTWSPLAGFAFNDRVVPYEVNTALFSDYALKQRAIYIPDGDAATYDPEHAFAFPFGSAIVKTFSFPADLRAPTDNLQLIETRLLIRYPDGWHRLPYIWNAEQTDAVLTPAGEVREISFIDATGAPLIAHYAVPQRNQCEECHSEKASASADVVFVPIGLQARHMNRSYDYGGSVGVRNQLDRLTELGMLTGAPAAASLPTTYDFRAIEIGGVAAIAPGELDTAARDYLDINCAHCHNPRGVNGMTSQLFLDHTNTDPFHLGVCKRPGSAGPGTGGFTFDIVPGDPDTSILYFRTHTTVMNAMMPLLGRSVTHTRGAELLHAWIAAMPANDCMTTP